MIKVQNLVYTYPGAKSPTVKDISFEVGAGEVFGFLGPSGSGKSTTQKILYKLLNGYQGHISINQKDLNRWGRNFYHLVGVGFELPNHYLKLTAYENLQFFGAFYPGAMRRAMPLLEQVGLAPDAHKRVADYSKGMKMRLNFVRAILHDPQVLFLDEPTSGLDPVNGKIIKDMILDLRQQGKTIFITTHSMFDADALCNRVALLNEGKIVALDAPNTLKLAHGQRKVRVTLKQHSPNVQEFDLDTLGQNQHFLQVLQNQQLETIHSEEATLEDVFIKLTGNRLL